MAAIELTNKNTEGTRMGQATSDLIAFYGATPISQRASATLTATASLFVMTGASHVANASTTVSGLFGFNSTEMVQLIDAFQEIRAFLVTIGLHKGGA